MEIFVLYFNKTNPNLFLKELVLLVLIWKNKFQNV